MRQLYYPCGFLWSQVEQKGLRGSAPARIDDKGRLKVPTMFRGVIQDQQGPDVFVTSLTGECVRIYPMPVWLEIERKLSQMPGNHPSRLKFLDRVNYYGQTERARRPGPRRHSAAPARQRLDCRRRARLRADRLPRSVERGAVRRRSCSASRGRTTTGCELSEHGI